MLSYLEPNVPKKHDFQSIYIYTIFPYVNKYNKNLEHLEQTDRTFIYVLYIYNVK